MSQPLILRSVAERELAEAYQWYESQEVGLGREFMRSVTAKLALIRRHSELANRVHRETRRSIVRRFPYSIFYVIQPERIVVIAIFHSSRDPLRWKSRG